MYIKAIGGYNEVGRNCTAAQVGDEVFLLDLGVHLENYIEFTENEQPAHADPEEMISAGAVPNIRELGAWQHNVKAILPTHAHLDHMGAIPFIGHYFDCPVLGTPFTTSVIKTVLKNEGIRLPNFVKTVEENSRVQLTNNVTAEYIHVTHSTPHTAMIALHTPEGVILYANDFKFDRTPTLGEPPNFKRLEELGKRGVKCLIADSTYSNTEGHVASEAYADKRLREILLDGDTDGKAIIVTTFSSHIARLRSIIDCGKKLNRRIMFLGRSLSKYVMAAEEVDLGNFSDQVEMVRFRKQIKRTLKQIMHEKEKYLFVVTGHQGEPQATLSRMVRDEISFRFDPGDIVVFSCQIIPTETNIQNRQELESALKQKQVEIFTDAHASGHAAREDLRELLQLVKPEHVIPAHGGPDMRGGLASLAKEEGYKEDQIHLISDGEETYIQ